MYLKVEEVGAWGNERTVSHLPAPFQLSAKARLGQAETMPWVAGSPLFKPSPIAFQSLD